ncbi:single-stranded DNA-binding protein [Corynebacterium amycolatum]|uniref:single-stranded DNA-binding protein n=2 Tax=Corynebacteriaceae TaxID=1653 RepID=UPI0008A2BA5A|nr:MULTISPECIES: single-stranded DNA-binding protein [Corynebacterium]MCA0444478.1 single-stranded DNA-binding protein [Corynebacterium amycolatum]MCQ9126173.1 single-stranded DNA-binding protein [Corynebacterium amycolatum]MCQ9170488.1 single-stranded DNA-binding protein [Corynebacterium amycolatum]MCQ9175919.1 single-stranded DNA-binding protein [Corynebacterium amycolatum]MDC7116176.1 single-stranded DNA-binding protein [Corynebacterium amycolatum]
MSEAVITVVGNVVHHVENRNTNSGAKVCKFSVASSKSWKGENGWEQSETSYFDVECWGKLAENVNNTVWKGQAVIVHGHVRTDRWEGDDGTKHQRQKIIAKAVGPNLRRHLATVKTMTEKPHESPTGLGESSTGDSEASVTETVVSQAGAVRTFTASTGGAGEAGNTGAASSEQREMADAGVSAPF